MQSNSDFPHLCLSLLEKLREDGLRNVFIDEVVKVVTGSVEDKLTVDACSRYLFYRILDQMYIAALKAGHAAIGVTETIGGQKTKSRVVALSAAQKFALEVAPFIKALRKTEYTSPNEIGNKPHGLDRSSPNGVKWGRERSVAR